MHWYHRFLRIMSYILRLCYRRAPRFQIKPEPNLGRAHCSQVAAHWVRFPYLVLWSGKGLILTSWFQVKLAAAAPARHATAWCIHCRALLSLQPCTGSPGKLRQATDDQSQPQSTASSGHLSKGLMVIKIGQMKYGTNKQQTRRSWTIGEGTSGHWTEQPVTLLEW